MQRRSPQLTAVLAALADGASHGMAIMQRTGLKSGTVYPILRRLEAAGWLVSRREVNDSELWRPARRTYQLTDRGLAEIQPPAQVAS